MLQKMTDTAAKLILLLKIAVLEDVPHEHADAIWERYKNINPLIDYAENAIEEARYLLEAEQHFNPDPSAPAPDNLTSMFL